LIRSAQSSRHAGKEVVLIDWDRFPVYHGRDEYYCCH
jgi:hypothetical protein